MGNCFRRCTGCDDSDSDSDRVSGYHPVPSYGADHGGRRPGHPAPVPSYGADHGGRRPGHSAPVPSYGADHGGRRPGDSAPVPSYGADDGGRRPGDLAPVPSYDADHGGRRPGYSAPPASVTVNIVAFKAVPRDLVDFAQTGKVPEALSEYVPASKATQMIWYTKLLAAWKWANPRPSTAEAAALLIVQTLQEDNIQGLLDFYRLTWPKNSGPANEPEPEVIRPEAGATWPKGVKFEIRTLPVQEARVGDGDGFVAFVDVYNDSREKENLPMEIEDAMNKRRHAKAQKNGKLAKYLKKQIEDGKYKVFDGKGGGGAQCLAREYRIRLRGVDAPEIGQSYGEEAKEKLIELVKGHKLLIHIYGKDQYDRWLGDVYQKDTFIQEVLLKEGFVWHYKFDDKRKKFAKWERDAKAAGLGLWADINPKMPWRYRRAQRKKGVSIERKGG